MTTSTYRFLNAEKTLVLRDESHVVQWDSSTNAPTGPNLPLSNETKIWEAAGSPMPQSFAPSEIVTPGAAAGVANLHGALDRAEKIADEATIAATNLKTALDQIERELPKLTANDIAGLRVQLQALTHVVRGLVGKGPP